LLVAQVLRLTGCDLVAIGRHPQKLAILERLRIGTRIASEPPSDTRYDMVVECTGKPAGFQSARAIVKPRGTLVLKSTFVGQSEVSLTSIVVDEVSLVGSRCGPFSPALRLLAMGLIDVEPLITAILPLGEALSAFQLARTAGTIKVLLRP
jgi:threonine dehydrogenase-like Zn-dependent dehydrogenase